MVRFSIRYALENPSERVIEEERGQELDYEKICQLKTLGNGDYVRSSTESAFPLKATAYSKAGGQSANQ